MSEETVLIRTLENRKSAKIALRVLRVIAFGYLLSGLFWVLFMIFSPSLILLGKQIVGFLISTLGWSLLFIQYILFVKPTLSVSIDLYPDKLIFRKGESKTLILFDEIENLEFKNIKYFLYGRLVLNLKTGESFKISSTFERLDSIVEFLNKHNPNLCSKEKYETILDQLLFIDHGIARTQYIYDQKIYLKYCLSIFLIIPLFFGLFIYFKQSNYLNNLGFDNYFAPLLSYLFVFPFAIFNIVLLFLNQYFYLKTKKQFQETKNKARDLFAEFNVFKKVFTTFAIFMFAFFSALTFTDKNTIISYSVTKNLPELSYKIGDHILIDQKFTKFYGKYALQQGDLVMVLVQNKKTLATIHLESTLQNRGLASTELNDTFAFDIQTLDGQKLKTNTNNIIGKVVSFNLK